MYKLYLIIGAYVLDSLTDNVTPYGVKAVQGFLSCVIGPSPDLKPIWLKVPDPLTRVDKARVCNSGILVCKSCF